MRLKLTILTMLVLFCVKAFGKSWYVEVGGTGNGTAFGNSLGSIQDVNYSPKSFTSFKTCKLFDGNLVTKPISLPNRNSLFCIDKLVTLFMHNNISNVRVQNSGEICVRLTFPIG